MRSGVGLAAVAGVSGAPAVPARAASRGVTVLVAEATNASVAAAPGGAAVLLDLLNVLWKVPAADGDAVALTGPDDDASLPDFSPDGHRIVCQAYTDGNFHLWLMNADGTGRRQLTSGQVDHREPRFSPDGTRIACAAETGGRYAIHVIDVESGKKTSRTTGTAQEAQPFWRPDGTAIAFTSGTNDAPQTVEQVTADGTRTSLAKVTAGRVAGPSFSPDGARLAYVHLTNTGTALVVDGRTVSEETDVFPFAARWAGPNELLYTADGRLRRRTLREGTAEDVPFRVRVTVPEVLERPAAVRDFDSTGSRPVKGVLGPALSPDGRSVAFGALGDLWVVRRGRDPKAIVSDGYRNTDPAWLPDGRALVHVSDRDGGVALWRYDLATGARTRLTDTALAAACPAVSPDGTTVAFISGGAALQTLDLATGAIRKVAGPLNAPIAAAVARAQPGDAVPPSPRTASGWPPPSWWHCSAVLRSHPLTARQA